MMAAWMADWGVAMRLRQEHQRTLAWRVLWGAYVMWMNPWQGRS